MSKATGVTDITDTNSLTMKFSTIIFWIFGVVITTLSVLLIATTFKFTGDYEILIVQSGSMEPTIKTGSIVLVKPIEKYRVGDIITFGANTRATIPTTHRLHAERVVSGELLYTTKGDVNEDPDPQEIRKQDIIGKVLFSLPYIGYLLDFARKPWGFALLIGLPAGIVIFDEIGKIWKEVAVYRRKKVVENNDQENNH